MTPWGSDNPIWIGPYPGKRTKGFPDIFGFEFVTIPHEYPGAFNTLPIYCVVEVKTKGDTLKQGQKNYLNYAVSIGGRGYVAMEDDSRKGYNLTEWVVK